MEILKQVKNNKEEIRNLDDWFRLCPPKGKEKQWKDQKSAKEFARYMTSELPRIPRTLKEFLSLTDDEAEAYPEFETHLELAGYDFGTHGPRNHDALMLTKDLVIGIEAKAGEKLGKKIPFPFKNTLSDNQKKRYYNTYEAIFGTKDIDSQIRYQLISASLGTFIEAVERKKNKAVLLIVSFKKDEVTSQDINYFCSALKRSQSDSKNRTIFTEHPEISFSVEHLELACQENKSTGKYDYLIEK
jgi:hypothetical protein